MREGARLVCLSVAAVAASAVSALGQAEAPFTQEASARGISFPTTDGRSFGTGAAFADLDNDGDPDLVVLGRMTPSPTRPYTVALYENVNGQFVLRSVGSGIPNIADGAGVSAGDYDGDGDLDLFISCWLSPSFLLRNDGNFRFTDVTAAMGISTNGAGQGSCWGDYDGDGWLDLYLANRWGTNFPDPPYPASTVPNCLFHNDSGTHFTDRAALENVQTNDPSFQPIFFDFDRDGDADLYLSNDKGYSRGCQVRNRFWKNVNGHFVDFSSTSGANGCIDAMCVAVGDFNRDRRMDLYITNLPVGNYLYINQASGRFIDRAAEAGVQSFATGWGSVFIDYNNDGWDDIFVGNTDAPKRLYRNSGMGTADDVAVDLGIGESDRSYCVAAADVDNDGDMDLLVVNTPFLPGSVGNVRLFINHEGERHHWAKFRMVGRLRNVFAIGAQLDIRSAEIWQSKEVIAGSNFKAQNDLTLHFGLGDATLVDEMEARWPGQGGVVERRLTGYRADRTWAIYPPERLGDVGGDGRVGSNDLFAFLTCFFASTGPVEVGCEIFDMDSNGQVTSNDFFLLLDRLFR